MTPSAPEVPGVPPVSGRLLFRPAVLVLAVLLLLPLCLGPKAAAWLSRLAILWRTPLERLGPVPASTLVALATALAVGLGLPRIPLAFSAGFLLGLPLGLAANLLGTLAGAWTEFALARRWPRPPPPPTAGRAILERWRRRPIPAIALLRLAPLPGVALNVALAFAPCSSRDFLLGSALGFLPAALPAVLAGSRLAF